MSRSALGLQTWFGRRECCTYRQAASVLPIPYADGLIVRGAHDPRVLREECVRGVTCDAWCAHHLVMELHGANIVQVPDQREGAAPKLVVPNFDLVVVASAHKKVPAQKMSRVEKRGKMSWS